MHKIKSYLGILSISGVSTSLLSVGLASFLIGGNSKIEGNFSIELGDIQYKNLNILNLSFPNEIIFDWNIEQLNSGQSNLNFVITGTIENYDIDWNEINFYLQVDKEHRENYYYLIDNGYLIEPKINSLTKECSLLTEGRTGTFYQNDLYNSAGIIKRDFILNYAFEYGSFFNFLSPNEFFNSNISNDFKAGNEYTDEEIKEIHNKFSILEDAKFTIYIDSTKENDKYALTFNANGGNFGNNETITFNNLDYHSIINPPIPSKAGEIFSDWGTISNVTYTPNTRIYLNELVDNRIHSITLNANWATLTSSLNINVLSSEEYIDAEVEVQIYSLFQEDITKQNLNNGINSISVNIGDTLIFTKLINVDDISFNNLEYDSDLDRYVVSGLNPSMTITPKKKISLNTEFSSTGITNPYNASFTILVEDGKSFNVTYEDISTHSIVLGDGIKFRIENALGFKNLEVENAILEDGWYILEENTLIKVTLSEKVNVSLVYDSTGVTKPIGEIDYYLDINDVRTQNQISYGNSSIVIAYDDLFLINDLHGLDSFEVDGAVLSDGKYKPNSNNVAITFKPKESLDIKYKKVDNDSKTPTISFDLKNDLGFSRSFNDVSCNASEGIIAENLFVEGDYINFTSWDNVDSDPVADKNVISVNPSECLLKDTLVLMADLTMKKVQDLNLGDLVLVFNHETGLIDKSPIIFINHKNEKEKEVNILKLKFDDDSSLEIVKDHALFDINLNKYVVISSNTVDKFINHKFYCYDGKRSYLVKLIDFEIYSSEENMYCPVTAFHMNLFANNILTMPTLSYDITGLYNIFKLDKDMKYDTKSKSEDIARYGLFSYEEFIKIIKISKEAFDVSPAVYLKVSLGKKLITKKQIKLIVNYLLNNSLIS